MANLYGGLQNLTAREPDGHNNAPDDVGEHGDTYIRITPAQYVVNHSDGSAGPGLLDGTGPYGMPLSKPPEDDFPGFNFFPFTAILAAETTGVLVGDMPQPRAVSNAVMALGPTPAEQNHPSSFAVNELFDFVGQFLTYDVAEAATAGTSDPPMLIDGLPFPFGRTPYEIEGGTRQQINEETSFLDLSMVYGNSQIREDLGRADTSPGSGVQSAKLLLGNDDLLPTILQVADDSGLTPLQVLTIFTEEGFGGLPDPSPPFGPPPADGTFDFLYYAGDNRVNQQGPLIVMQTIWAREHNYQVDQIAPHAAGWTQDELFEAARAVTEAEWQHIVFDEYVPTLIGSNADTLLTAYKNFVGLGTYNAIGPGIINEWTTVAFRFGHDQSSNEYTLLNADGSDYLPEPLTLGDAFLIAGNAAPVPGSASSAEDIDAWIRGLSAQFAQEIDGRVADGNRNALFGIPNTIVDLEAFDIQRGRDHGVWNYNALRAGLGLGFYASFDDFADANGYEEDDPRIIALKNVYGNDISKLDSIVGGMLEQRYMDSQLGETFTLLNAIQFDVLKDDAFYYENRLADNPELLAEIKGTPFAEVIGRNSGAEHMHLDTFQVAKEWEGGAKSETRNGADDATVLEADLMIGNAGNDTLNGKEGSDTLYGDAGNDRLNGGNGDDFLRGGEGNDRVDGGYGNDNAEGGGGNDNIILGKGNDWASGGAGSDDIDGGDGDDIALGNEGNDNIRGGKGADELFGSDGNDKLAGDADNDKLYGGAGADEMAGGTGMDRLEGGTGNDKLDGGADSDTFVFGPGFGQDRITGFDANPSGGQDFIDLTAFGITEGDFASHVTIADVGADTLVTIDNNPGQTIRLVGVGNATTVTADDFLLLP